MKKLTSVCVAAAVIFGSSLAAEAGNQGRSPQYQRNGNVQGQVYKKFPKWKWKRPPKHDGGDKVTPPPRRAPRQDGLTFRNRTNKHIVMYVYGPNDNTRLFTMKDIRIEPGGTATWPQADNQYAQVWLKAMELGGVHVVAPERKVGTRNVINIYQNRMTIGR